MLHVGYFGQEKQSMEEAADWIKASKSTTTAINKKAVAPVKGEARSEQLFVSEVTPLPTCTTGSLQCMSHCPYQKATATKRRGEYIQQVAECHIAMRELKKERREECVTRPVIPKSLTTLRTQKTKEYMRLVA
ncbi:hypothetical protein NDU88_002157 [Pleurodeles waltl]|uniref:Uncharacterized protein n=1 Tax=Pleurodeles waltl TaxID=8319 RepID=A0AAV7KUT2_PLEWA|nr:hypothetical protein NDU88_002157 [Pleurodeles waltl]